MTTKANEKVQKLGGFIIKDVEHGILFDESNGMYPSKMFGYTGEPEVFGSKVSTSYGIIKTGEVLLKIDGAVWGPLKEGQYFSVQGLFELSGNAEVVINERIGFKGVFTIAGPVEKQGRLSYIDGCSDSLLIYPPRLGDPVFNILWFPKNVKQTMHIHPSIRFGYVLYGNGRCVTPEGEVPLTEGKVFRLSEMAQHCFNTDDSEMAIVAYHPDSDWGPTDTNHPMLNRTLIR
ncbi:MULTISPECIES: hypothetical protein [Bacillus]|uniref:hypothetical protein n=1 Tax=Bacillus TaxID=1386 RepID=UPI0020CDF040|nr:hypothetical protein [Bacillus safensis]MCP9282875.1 hypothetical protein [Bacillus safensis]